MKPLLPRLVATISDGWRLLIASTLAGCLVLLLALVYPATVPHALHHLHHGVATHGTLICSWLCAAGQEAEGVALGLPGVSLAPNRALCLPERAAPSLFAIEGSSRAPPSCHSV